MWVVALLFFLRGAPARRACLPLAQLFEGGVNKGAFIGHALHTRTRALAILFGQSRIAFLAHRREGWAHSRETGRGSHTDTHCPIAIHAGPVYVAPRDATPQV